MKKSIKVIGIVLVIIILLFVAGYYFLLKPGIALDKESRAVAEELSTKIAGAWDINELKNNSSPELVEIINNDPETTAKLFSTFQTRLGKLKTLSDLNGQALVTLTNKRQDITATYQGEATFEKGDGTILIRLIKRDGEWKILNFKVNSNALLQ